MTPWPEVLDEISRDLAHWNAEKLTLEGRRHILPAKPQGIQSVGGLTMAVFDVPSKLST
jgi:hypothetical protein